MQGGPGPGPGPGGVSDIARPYAVWQLFNGSWYWLDDETKAWHPAPGGPMQSSHLQSQNAVASSSRKPPTSRSLTRREGYTDDSSDVYDQIVRERRGTHHRSHKRSKEEEERERTEMIEAATINATATATAVAAVAAPVAAGVALQVWQSLQQGFFVQGANIQQPGVDMASIKLAVSSALHNQSNMTPRKM
jgi:hypothetical protein